MLLQTGQAQAVADFLPEGCWLQTCSCALCLRRVDPEVARNVFVQRRLQARVMLFTFAGKWVAGDVDQLDADELGAHDQVLLVVNRVVAEVELDQIREYVPGRLVVLAIDEHT